MQVLEEHRQAVQPYLHIHNFTDVKLLIGAAFCFKAPFSLPQETHALTVGDMMMASSSSSQ